MLPRPSPARPLSKQAYKAQALLLREELLAVQQRLRQASFPVVVLFSGVDGAGKGETVNLLHEWMDPRWLHTHAYGEPSDEERERPEHWRFWRDLPPKGQIGILMNAWYAAPIDRRAHRVTTATEFRRELQRNRAPRATAHRRRRADPEVHDAPRARHAARAPQGARTRPPDALASHRRAVAPGAVVRRAGRGRGHGGAADRCEPGAVDAGGRVRRAAPQPCRRARHPRSGDAAPRRGGAGPAPRRVAAAGQGAAARVEAPDDAGGRPTGRTLADLDMSRAVGKAAYDVALAQAQGRLNLLHRKARRRGLSTILVFEGWDAAGKGGAIRRVASALDAREYQVIPVAAPTDEERAQHYLWRFWRHLSRAGRLTIFDRSWYGRVLVERVEGFAQDAEWQRAYDEINDFEAQLIAHGIVLVKYWLHISKDEQLRRFKQRERLAHKRWKLTDEDWRNRKQWKAYERAVDDMVAQHEHAAGAVDADRRRRQEPRATEGAADAGRPARASVA